MKSRYACAPVLLLLLAGCSSQAPQPTPKTSQPAKAEKKEAVPLKGREAFQKMFVSAHGWVADAKPFRLESQPNQESNGKDGKAVIWRGGFASLSRRGIKSFLWSGSTLPDAPSPGVSSGVEDSYNPSNSSTQTFDMAFLKIDSDKAYETALKHGGEKLIKAKADQPVMYTLDWSARENILTWHVVFGTGLQDAKLRVAINASTGDFIRLEK